MKRVLICTHLSLETNTGAVDRIVQLANHVSRNDVDVFLVNRSLKKSFLSALVDGDVYYQIRNGVKIKRNYPLSIRLLFPGVIKFFQEILNKAIGVVTSSSLSEVWLSYAFDPYLFVKLFFVCKREKIDIIQCEFPMTALTSIMVKKLLSTPLVFDEHNVEAERLRSMASASGVIITITKLLEKMSCMLCDLVFVVSEADKRQLTLWAVPERKIKVIPNSVSLEKSLSLNGSELRKKYNFNSGIVTLIFHGDLSYPPNEEASRILAHSLLDMILAKYPNVYLLLVGRNPPLISHPNIIVTGFVANLDEYIAAADIAVVPLLKGGGTRIKILEYMALGKAVVSTMKGAEGLSVEDGVDIFLTKYPDSEFADKVCKLVGDPDLRREMGIKAREKIEVLYDWEKTSKKAVQAYDEVFSKPGA
jgi:glycosyltransferase involved in cell wall biosynthesis